MDKHTTPRLRLLGAAGARWYFWTKSLVRNRDVLKFPMDPGSWIPPSASYSYYMNYAEVLKVILIHRIRLNLLTDYGRKFEVEYRVLI